MIYTVYICIRSMVEEDVERYGIHLLVMSHVYQVSWLKRKCETTLSTLLTTETILDLLQLSRLCDAQRLHMRCLRFIVKDFAAVQETEAWRFLQENDPWLELDILQFMDEADLVSFVFDYTFVSFYAFNLFQVVVRNVHFGVSV